MTRQALEAPVNAAEQANGQPTDKFAQLAHLKQVALTFARKVLGQTGGKLLALTPQQSAEFRTLGRA